MYQLFVTASVWISSKDVLNGHSIHERSHIMSSVELCCPFLQRLSSDQPLTDTWSCALYMADHTTCSMFRCRVPPELSSIMETSINNMLSCVFSRDDSVWVLLMLSYCPLIEVVAGSSHELCHVEQRSTPPSWSYIHISTYWLNNKSLATMIEAHAYTPCCPLTSSICSSNKLEDSSWLLAQYLFRAWHVMMLCCMCGSNTAMLSHYQRPRPLLSQQSRTTRTYDLYTDTRKRKNTLRPF